MSEVRKYRKFRQREPLRVPSSWKSEDRAFAIQLNGQLDEIYAKLGRIQQSAEETAELLSSSIETRGKMAKVGWGRELVVDGILHGILMISYRQPVFIWMPGTSDIHLYYYFDTGVFSSKSSTDGTGTLSFSFNSDTGSNYTLTRSGQKLTITKNTTGNASMTLFYA